MRKTAREAAEAEARTASEADQARTKLEREADLHMHHVESCLGALEADQDGWDFEGKRYEYTKQIKREIRADLIEDLPLDSAAGRARVQELVDECLANHWQPPESK